MCTSYILNGQVVEFVTGIPEEIKIKSHGNTSSCNPNMLEINPTVGCQFQCQYCSSCTQEEKNDFEKVFVFSDYPQYLDSFLADNKDKRDKIYFYFSPKIDCLQACLVESGITEEILNILHKHCMKYFFLTKGSIPPKSIQQLLIDSKDLNQVIASCTMPNESVRQRLEPYAASIEERMAFAQFCIDSGIFTTAIFSPILPVDGMNYIERYIDRYLKMGIDHFHLDFAELSALSLAKLTSLVPEYADELNNVYLAPNVITSQWQIPFKDTETVRYWPDAHFIQEAFKRFAKYATSIEPRASITACDSLCARFHFEYLNTNAHKKNLSCMGTRLSTTVVKRKNTQ
ncbi:MAG: hypothetical protein FWC33_02100 [Candidatus Bathyarchaeota archaeon]|nr:hypothetical protein [Candidatus Termiticorpusculum sp.]